MGRQSDYATMHAKGNKKECAYEQIKDKFGKETMSTTEFAVYLSEISGVHIDEKTVKNRIKAICEDSNGALSVKDFKHGPSNGWSKYELKPEYHSVLFALMNTDYFDGRRNDRRLSTRARLYEQLASNIENYLPEEEKKVVKANPAYVNAVLESFLSNHINGELSALLRALYHSDTVLRYELMIRFLENLILFRKWIESLDSKTVAVRMVYAHNLDELEDAKYQKGLFESVTLDQFLIHYLALQVHNQKYEYISDKEILSMPAMRLAAELFHIKVDGNQPVKETLARMDAEIENQSRYKEIVEKAEKILNLRDPVEHSVFETLKQLISIQYLCPEVTPEDYERTVRFTESAIADDKWDLVNKFVQFGRQHMSKEDIDALDDFIKKRKK